MVSMQQYKPGDSLMCRTLANHPQVILQGPGVAAVPNFQPALAVKHNDHVMPCPADQ